MSLTIIPDNPAPPRPVELAILTADRLSLRTVRWLPSSADVRGTVTIAQGRGEFVEKYFEVAADLLARGFAVVAFDWRGQGGSTRELSDPRKGHVGDFKHYLRDLAALEHKVLAPFAPKPWFALGHSTGGAILLDAAHDGALPFERMFLTGPMVDIAPKLRPRGARLLARALALSGFKTSFIPGGQRNALQLRPFDGNPLTSDPVRYLRAAAVLTQNPQLAVGAPTVGWIDSAFQTFTRFAQPSYAAAIMTPIFILTCGDDELVDSAAAERLAMRLKAGRHAMLPGAKHEILVEVDRLRDRFWAAFDAFIPGQTLDAPTLGARRDLAPAKAFSR